MIFRWKCDGCKKEIESGVKRFKVIQLNPYIYDGDLCSICWKEIKEVEKEGENDTINK